MEYMKAKLEPRAASFPPFHVIQEPGCKCGITQYTFFWINRRALLQIINVLSMALGAVAAGLKDYATAALVLGIIVAVLNGVATVVNPEGPQVAVTPARRTARISKTADLAVPEPAHKIEERSPWPFKPFLEGIF
jgi:hypothetical protein